MRAVRTQRPFGNAGDPFTIQMQKVNPMRIGPGLSAVFAFLLLGAALTGCAASVTKSTPSDSQVRAGLDSSKTIALNVTGSGVATESRNWDKFKDVWRTSMQDEATEIGAAFVSQDGPAKWTGQAGTLVLVNIDDFRYLSTGMRIAFGIMTGNAFITAHVQFLDLSTGSVIGERSYDTTSTAWQGVFSAMTAKQVEAICKDIGGEIDHH
jgi:hypothetical protein